jgi:hypothetical protein
MYLSSLLKGMRVTVYPANRRRRENGPLPQGVNRVDTHFERINSYRYEACERFLCYRAILLHPAEQQPTYPTLAEEITSLTDVHASSSEELPAGTLSEVMPWIQVLHFMRIVRGQ